MCRSQGHISRVITHLAKNAPVCCYSVSRDRQAWFTSYVSTIRVYTVKSDNSLYCSTNYYLSDDSFQKNKYLVSPTSCNIISTMLFLCNCLSLHLHIRIYVLVIL